MLDELIELLKQINKISPSVKYQLSVDDKGRWYLIVPFDTVLNLGKDMEAIPAQLKEKIKLMEYVRDNRDKLVENLWPYDDDDKNNPYIGFSDADK